jgi:hypothetical protein
MIYTIPAVISVDGLHGHRSHCNRTIFKVSRLEVAVCVSATKHSFGVRLNGGSACWCQMPATDAECF